MGNNPCLPYDTCIHAFAGKDADIVLWKQSYNCWKGSAFICTWTRAAPRPPLVILAGGAQGRHTK